MASSQEVGAVSLLLTLCFLCLDYLVADVMASTAWEHLSLRYGTWYRPPKTPREAVAMGYKRMNGICQMDTYHGFLYVQTHNDKSRLIFDLNDRLAGIQTAIPGNLHGYNSINETVRVPTKETIPPVLLSQEQYSPGVQMYTITAYFKHPSLICSPYTQHAHPGKGLYIQMGYRVEKQFEKIPLDAHHLTDEWKSGICLPSMGRHYFKNLTKDLQCEKLNPVFLLYNGEGQLGGFGWLFQGVPPPESPRAPVKWFKYSVQFYPAIFDPSMLPPCMSNPEFHIFGIRIYLRNEHSMNCPHPRGSADDDEDSDNTEENDGRPPVDGPGDTEKDDEEPEEVTFRPLYPWRSLPNTTVAPRAPKYTNSRSNNVIVDDAIREKAGHSHSASLKTYSPSLFSVTIFGVVLATCLNLHISIRTDISKQPHDVR